MVDFVIVHVDRRAWKNMRKIRLVEVKRVKAGSEVLIFEIPDGNVLDWCAKVHSI